MPSEQPQLYLYGSGGHARSLTETAIAAGFFVAAYVDARRAGETQLGFDVVAELPTSTDHLCVTVAIGDNFHRQRVSQELLRSRPHVTFPALIHPSASVSSFATIGDHVCILQNATVGTQAVLSEGALVNTAASIDHDCQIGPYASLGPGSTLGGTVSIGERSSIGLGAKIHHARTIGNDTLLGAGSYLHSDLGHAVVAFGSPARIVRSRSMGDPYL